MTELGPSTCEGELTPWDCSGLAVVTRLPHLQTEFRRFGARGAWLATDGERWAGKGAGRVRVELRPGIQVDIFITHTAADTGHHSNQFYRDQQIQQVQRIARRMLRKHPIQSFKYLFLVAQQLYMSSC